MDDPESRARPYFTAISLVGLAFLAALIAWDRSSFVDYGTADHIGAFWLTIYLTLFAFAATLAPVTTPTGVYLTGSLAPLYAAVLVLPPGPAALVATIGTVDARIPGRNISWGRFLFNRGQFALVYGLAAVANHFIVGIYHPACTSGLCLGDTMILVSGALIAIVLIAALNTPIVVVGAALLTGTNFRRVAYQGLQGLLISYVGLAPLGALIAYLIRDRTPGSLGIAATIAILLFVYRYLSQRSHNLEHVIEGSYVSQARLIDKKDGSTFGHSERVGELSERIANKLGLSEELTAQIRIGATLHDIGKIAIPDAVLHKTGKLTEEDWELLKTHTVQGWDVLREQQALSKAAEIVRGHHENYDGSGYPDNLQARAIPVGARITRVVDSYDCITNTRDYKPWTKSPFEAVSELASMAGTTYDPEVVEAFIDVMLEVNPELRTLRQTADASDRGSIRDALSYRPFARLWVGQALSNFGDMLTTTGLALTAFAQSRSLLAVGLVFAARALPNLVFGLLGSPLVDRADRRSLMLLMDVARAILVLSLPLLLSTSLALILLIAFLVSVATSLFNPARDAAIPDLVSPRLLHASTAAMSAAQKVTEILGYLAAAGIILLGGVPLLFAIDALTFLVSAGFILTVPFPEIIRETRRLNMRRMQEDLLEGFNHIRRNPQLRAMLTFGFFMAAGASALLPLIVPLAIERLNAGQPGYGILEASIAAGATLGSFLAAALRGARRGSLMIAGAVGMGFASIFVGLSPALPLAAIFLFAGGVANLVYFVPMYSAIAEVTDTGVRGRVYAARFTLTQVGTLIGIGYATLLTIRFAPGDAAAIGIVISGGMMLVVAGIAAASRGLRNI